MLRCEDKTKRIGFNDFRYQIDDFWVFKFEIMF